MTSLYITCTKNFNIFTLTLTPGGFAIALHVLRTGELKIQTFLEIKRSFPFFDPLLLLLLPFTLYFFILIFLCCCSRLLFLCIAKITYILLCFCMPQLHIQLCTGTPQNIYSEASLIRTHVWEPIMIIYRESDSFIRIFISGYSFIRTVDLGTGVQISEGPLHSVT